MKYMHWLPFHRGICCGAILFCSGLLSGQALLAADAKATTAPVKTPEEDPIFTNWVDLTLGGLIPHGNMAQFRQNNPTLGPVFGGISDMHIQESAGKAIVTLDARAIFANSDYKVKLDVSLPDVGYIRGGFTEFCTYSNGNGGYLPPTSSLPNTMLADGLFFPGQAYALYRGSLWVEMGLRVPHFPEITLRYEHDWRSGQEDSTIWGGAQTGAPATQGVTTGVSNVRKIVPAFRNISETRDIFTFNAKHTFGKPETFGNTEVDLGMRYEFDRNNDSLNFQNLPGAQPTGTSANNYYITQTDKLSLALYDGHLSTLTRFGDKLWLTMGFSYAAASTDIGGNRIAGPANGVAYSPIYNNIWYAGKSGAYLDLGGGSTFGQSIATLNLMWTPIESLQITPSVRVECTNTRSTSSNYTEFGQGGPNASGVQSSPTLVNSHVFLTAVSQCLQLRYTGIKNWVFYAQGDWSEEYQSRGDSTPGNSFSTPNSVLNFSANNSSLSQKYMFGANWYPLPNLNMAVQYYLQLQDFSQNIHSDDPVQTNQRLVAQSWNTNDVNFRVTWQPLPSLSIVSRYDFQRTTINSQWAADPGPLTNSPQGALFTAPDGQSALITNNMFTETLTWTPIERLYLQGSLSYVLNKIASPAAQQTSANGISSADVPGSSAILNFNNNYWTASAGLGFAIDHKNEIRWDFTFYSANNYVNNEQYGVPYGSSASEYTFSASLSRQITKNVRLSVKYYFDTYVDQLSGGNSNYTAQMISSSLQVRF